MTLAVEGAQMTPVSDNGYVPACRHLVDLAPGSSGGH